MVTAVLPGMLQRGSGYIVNFSSGAGFLAPFGYAAYVPSKFAVRGFSDAPAPGTQAAWACVCPWSFRQTQIRPGMENENKTKPFETLEAFSTKLVSADAGREGRS